MLLTSLYHYLTAFTIGFGGGLVLGVVGSTLRQMSKCAEISAEIRGS